MSELIKLEIKCPCGRLLEIRSVTPSSSTSFTKKCSSCKQDIFIQIRNGKAYTSYK